MHTHTHTHTSTHAHAHTHTHSHPQVDLKIRTAANQGGKTLTAKLPARSIQVWALVVGGWGEGREGAISREGGERGGNNIRYYSLLIDENV